MRAGRPCVVQLLNYRKRGDPFINYLSVTPGSAAAFTVSSINFTATDIANGGIVRLSTGGNVKVFCGDNTGSTDFIIDITGYYI